MCEFEGAVADGDCGGGRVVVVMRRRLRARRRCALRGGLALPGRIAPEDLGAGLPSQRRQRRAASAGQSVNGFIKLTQTTVFSAPGQQQTNPPLKLTA
jgi:hypothetical protein